MPIVTASSKKEDKIIKGDQISLLLIINSQFLLWSILLPLSSFHFPLNLQLPHQFTHALQR